MAQYTASLVAQNTSVYVCDIVKPHNANDWFANAMIGGTLGSGTVALSISPDDGTTKYPINQDGTATAASATAAIALNIRCGNTNKNTNLKLYASIATATNPAVTITVCDNRG